MPDKIPCEVRDADCPMFFVARLLFPYVPLGNGYTPSRLGRGVRLVGPTGHVYSLRPQGVADAV